MQFNHSTLLLEVTAADNVDRTGAVKNIASGQNTNAYKFFVKATQTGGATSPATKTMLETSPDNSNWFKIAEVTTDGTTTSKVDMVDVPALCQYNRARTEISGATKPTLAVKAMLLADRPVKLAK